MLKSVILSKTTTTNWPKKANDKRKADPQISRIEIERTQNKMTIIIRTAHPGVVIGQEW